MELKKAALWVVESGGVRLEVEQDPNWTCQQHAISPQHAWAAQWLDLDSGDRQCLWTYRNAVS